MRIDATQFMRAATQAGYPTRKDVVNFAGISRSTLARVFDGKKPPPARFIAWAESVGIDLTEMRIPAR